MLNMQKTSAQAFLLRDGRGKDLGQITVEESRGGLVSGRFHPGPGFDRVEPLFLAFEEAVNCQALGAVDRRAADIAALDLRLVSPDGTEAAAIHDVQIWSDGGFSCRSVTVTPEERKALKKRL